MGPIFGLFLNILILLNCHPGGGEAAAGRAIGNSVLEVGNACGPHGEQDDEQVTTGLFIRPEKNFC